MDQNLKSRFLDMSRTVSFLALCLFAAALSGCHSASPALVSTPAVSVRTTPQPALSSNAHLAAIAHVQSRPLYQQAEQACQKGQYQQAADLLDRLAATPGLNAQEISFCHEQRDIALGDAGVKVSRKEREERKEKEQSKAHLDAELQSPLASGREQTQKEDTLAKGDPDCGPRALLLVCQQLGVQADLETLRQKAGMSEKGVSLEGLKQACEALHLHAEGVQLSREELAKAKMPAIAWIGKGEGHFIAVLKMEGNGTGATATIHDPNQPSDQRISQERLLRLSQGYLLMVHR